jgi:hypothetical protein
VNSVHFSVLPTGNNVLHVGAQAQLLVRDLTFFQVHRFYCRRHGEGKRLGGQPWFVVLPADHHNVPIHLVRCLVSGMMDWDTTRIVFTKRGLLEFLRFIFVGS